jgi:uncharacterized protein (TIGR00375 family)
MHEYDVDFHIHSKYSKSVSPDMEVPVIAKQAVLKGLDIVGTGDALCPPWLDHLKQCLKETGKGIYSTPGSATRFIITTEVEDIHCVHHIILFPEISSAADLMERLKKYSNDIEREGRPHIRLTGEEIVDHANESGALVGPAHAFTPWTALYKEYDSLDACYGSNAKHVKFLELGLSADTYMADRVEELQGVTFMSNSDTHSPWPQRLGREFNRLLMDEPSFDEIDNCIETKNGRRFSLNVGLDPREGKYHLTACSKCFVRFRLEDAVRLKWHCPECGGGVIKKGVVDRINELAEWDTPHHPPVRPRYVHIIPLAEVISLVTGVRTMTGRKIKERWDSLIQKFGTEINILIDSDIEEIKKADPEVGKVIEKFRADKIRYVSGGGGQYGRPTLKDEEDNYWGRGQKTLFDF